jgi:hypothetical protein
MNGGLLNKSISRVALAAAAGLFMGGMAMPSAKAADLGGDCCADLEERVAELEATTARKGNRRMSLTVTGQVHRGVLWWDDGKRSDTYYGLDNTNSSSRFSFLGEAKVTSTVKMGFEIMIEIEAGGTSSKVSQFDEDGKVGTQINGFGAASFNASNVDAYFGDARRAAWWIEDSRLGRVTVGRYESAGVVNTIDLGGISAGASSSVVLINGSFLIRGTNGEFFSMPWSRLGDPAASQGRTELVRYDSPTIAGFIFSASIAEAGDYWGTMLRYAGEFSGFRIAAGIGYENVTDRQTTVAFNPITASGGAATAGPNDLTAAKPKIEAWGASGALLHVPTGLFVQGHYMAVDYNGANGGTSQYWGQDAANKKNPDQWMIQAGISKNWFGLGNTALYGEYSRSNDWGAGLGAGRDYATAVAASGVFPAIASNLPGATAVFDVTSTKLDVWGVGIVQNIDAAATELYIGWRRFDAGITGALTNGGAQVKINTEDADFVFGGARMKF